MSSDYAKPRGLPMLPVAIFAALVVVGFGIFAVAAGDADTSERAYRAYLQNFLLFAALSQGALVLSAGIRLTNGRWAGPIHRLIDCLGAFVPVSILLYLVLWSGRHELFHWMSDPEEVLYKEWWYEEGFMLKRDLFALVWMAFVSFLYLYASIRPMLAKARETATGWQASLISAWTSGWRGEEAERARSLRVGRKLAAVLALSYAFAYSTLGVDLVMGLAPHWLSTMFPAYYAWGGFLSAVSLTAFLAVVLREGPDLRGEVTENRRHDLGKMVFAFSIFWMYLFWSQYLVIWYGNIPEETGFLAARLGSEFLQDTWYMEGFWDRLAEPYVKTTLVAWFLCWVIPFWVLLGQRPKKTPAILATVALGSVVGFWIERFILVTPSLVTPSDILAGAPVATHPFGFIEIGVTAGFAGLFFLSFLLFAKVFPGGLPPREA